MDAILTIAAIVAPGLIAWFMHQKAARAEAQARYLREAAERRRKAAIRKGELQATMDQVDAGLAKAKEGNSAEAAEELEKVYADTSKKGAAHAAMEHLKRLKVLVLAVAIAAAPLEARAERCENGISVKAGDTVPCDVECIPEAALLTLVKRSVELENLKKDHADTLMAHQRKVETLEQAVRDAEAETLAAEASCVKHLEPSGPSTSTLILIGVVIFVVGAGSGALAYHQLR